eukprot:3499185-Pleurochrysis_carterae.AAC.1
MTLMTVLTDSSQYVHHSLHQIGTKRLHCNAPDRLECFECNAATIGHLSFKARQPSTGFDIIVPPEDV